MIKSLPAMQETLVRSLGQEDALEKGMATHSSIPAWRYTLLYSTGNYIQYPVVNHNGKDYEKNGLYMCVCMNHLAVQQKFTQHCKSTYLT